MGLWDSIKGAVNVVTGGGAKVNIEWQPALIMPGAPVKVRVTATSTGGELKSGGAFVDVLGSENVNVRNVSTGPTPTPTPGNPHPKATTDVHVSKATFEQSFQIAPAFVLGANETKTFEGTVTLPGNAQPSFQGAYAVHQWSMRGRIEAFGNDPDSGFKVMRVGMSS